MRTIALLLALAVAVHAAPVRAEAPQKTQRGVLTGVGLGLLVAGAAGIGLGTAGVLMANDSAARMQAYGPITTIDPAAGSVIIARHAEGVWLGLISYAAAGLALIAGSVLLAVDRPRPMVAFVPTAGGGAFVFSTAF